MKSSEIKEGGILFANGRMPHPFFVGGDSVNTHTLARELHRRGVRTEVLGVSNPKHHPLEEEEICTRLRDLGLEYVLNNNFGHTQSISYHSPYRNCMVDIAEFIQALHERVETMSPDVIVTQLECSPEVIDYCYDNGVPCMLYLHDNEPENEFALSKEEKIDYVLFNSRYTRNKYKGHITKPSEVLYPLFEFSDYEVEENSRKYVTMVNPVPEKGAEVFLQLVKSFPDIEFMAVEGWYKPDIDFTAYPNLTFLPKQQNMKNVFSQTRILLCPSQWEEGFGRINVEALINGIPVIASNRGGIPEAVGGGGLMVEDYSNPCAWKEKLSQLEGSRDLYSELSAQGRVHAPQFNVRSQIHRLCEVTQRVVCSTYPSDKPVQDGM